MARPGCRARLPSAVVRHPALTRILLIAAVIVGAGGGTVLSGGARADSAATTGTTPTTPTGPVLALPAFGDISSSRFALMRGLDLPVTTSEAATIRVELVIPRSIARKLKVKVGKGQVRAVLARTTVTAEGAGDVIARPRFSKRIANRLAAKRRHFKLGVRAIAGSTVVSGTVTIKTKD